jgi:hypothetical protein
VTEHLAASCVEREAREYYTTTRIWFARKAPADGVIQTDIARTLSA